jgi:hypothetical protein
MSTNWCWISLNFHAVFGEGEVSARQWVFRIEAISVYDRSGI